MSNGTNVTVNLAFTADTGKVRSQLMDLQQQLQKITSASLSRNGLFKGFSTEMNEAAKAASQLQAQLQSCINVETGKLDLTKFTQSLQQSGIKMSDYATKLAALGPAGEKAFASMAQAIGNAEIPLQKSSGMLATFATNLKKVAQWQLSSSVIHGFMRSIQAAYGYAQDLNASLNNIRIVTGQSIEQMDAFAKKANEAAKALSTTTNNYAKASLIFYQQGLGDADVKARTDAVMKMVNVTKDSAEEVSSYMTAIWNNFDDGTKSLEHYADVMTALGAATASSTAEIAAGLEKFASIGDTIGLSYEYATSALATIVAQTRQSSEVVGNGLRTIFSRLQGLKLGETLDDGVTLNKYSQALNNVGVQILDAAGNMKDMDTILDDLASKWQKLSKAQQTALAQTVGGVRQYTTLISLMDNWKSMEQNLMTAENSSGTLQAQQDIYAESWKAAADEVRAAWEGVWQVLVDDDFFISMLNGIEKVVAGVHTLIDSMGGLKGVMSGVGVLVTSIFGKDMIASLDRFATSLQYKASGGNQAAINTKIDANKAMMEMHQDKDTPGDLIAANAYKMQGEAQNLLIANANKMNAAEKSQAQLLLEQLQIRTQLMVAAGEQAESEQRIVDKSKKTIENLTAMEATQNVLKNSGITGLTAESINKDLEALKKLQEQYNALAPSANSIGAILDSSFGSPSEKIAAITQHMEDLKQKFADIGGAPDNVSQAMDRLNKALASGDWKTIVAEYNNLSKVMTELEVHIVGAENALLALKGIDINQVAKTEEEKAAYQQLIKAIEEYIAAERRKGEALQEGAHHQEQAINTMNLYKQQLENLSKNAKTFGEAVVGTMRGISSIMMGLNSLLSIGDVFADDSLSGWQKFSKIVLSLSMGLPMLITGYEALHKAQLKKAATNVADAAGTLLQTAAQKALTTALGKTAIGQWALNAAMNANPVGLFLGAVVALVAALAGLAGIITLVVNAINKPTDTEVKLKKAKEAADSLAESYNDVKESYNELMSDIAGYESVVTDLENCTAGTEAWRAKTQELSDTIQALLVKYPQLAKYGSNITLGLQELQTAAERELLASQLASIHANNTNARLANTTDMNLAYLTQRNLPSREATEAYRMLIRSEFQSAISQSYEDLFYGPNPTLTKDKTVKIGKKNVRTDQGFTGVLRDTDSISSDDMLAKAFQNMDYDDLMQLPAFQAFTASGDKEQLILDLYGYIITKYLSENGSYSTVNGSGEKITALAVEDFITTEGNKVTGINQNPYTKGQEYDQAAYNYLSTAGLQYALNMAAMVTGGEFSYGGRTDEYQLVTDADVFRSENLAYRDALTASVQSALYSDEQDEDYITLVAATRALQAAEQLIDANEDKSASELVNLMGGTNFAKGKTINGVQYYTYTDQFGNQQNRSQSDLNYTYAWNAVTNNEQSYLASARRLAVNAESNPELKSLIVNKNLDTWTRANLSQWGNLETSELNDSSAIQQLLLDKFGYDDINLLAQDMGFMGETAAQDLMTYFTKLLTSAFKAPAEVVKQLDNTVKVKYGEQVQKFLSDREDLSLADNGALVQLLNEANAASGLTGVSDLYSIISGYKGDLPTFLNALSSMDWSKINSVEDLNAILSEQDIVISDLGNKWTTYSAALVRSKSNIASIIPNADDLNTAVSMKGTKAGDTIDAKAYNALIEAGQSLTGKVLRTGLDEYTFIEDFTPDLMTTIKSAEQFHDILSGIDKDFKTIDTTSEDWLTTFKTKILDSDSGKNLLASMGISLKEEDYANAEYMLSIYNQISSLLVANSTYDSNLMKSLLYGSAETEEELLSMATTLEGVTSFENFDVDAGTPLANALKLIRNTAEETKESFDALTTSATTALSILQNLSFGSSISAETYNQLIDYNNELANSFVQLADGSYRFIGSSSDIDSKIKTLIQSYDTIQSATIKDDFSSESNLAKYADKTNLGAADLKALELAGYTQDEVAQLIKSKDEKAIAAFNAAMQQVFATKPKELIASMATSIGQLGSYKQTYGLGASEVKAQGQYLMSQATTLDELKAMQTELTTGETFKSLNIATTDLTNGYVAGLLNIANGYASCKDEVKAYYEAVAKGDTAGISTAQTNLENAIALEDLATQYNTTTQAILAYKAIAGSTTTNEDAAKAIAKAKSLSALNKEYSDLVELGNSINTDDDGNDILTSILGDSEDFEAFVQAQEYFSDVFGKEITEQNTADLLQALDDEAGFKTLAKTLGMTEESANSLWTSLTEVEVDPFQQATDALSQAATKLANDLEEAKAQAENAKTVFTELMTVLSDKDGKKSVAYLEGLRDLGLSSTSSASAITKKYLDLQHEAIFKSKIDFNSLLNDDGSDFKQIDLTSIINLTDTEKLSAKLSAIFTDPNVANVAKEYFDKIYSETGSYTTATTQGLLAHMKAHNEALGEEWENFLANFIDNLTSTVQAQLEIEQEAAAKTANAWIAAYEAISAAREGIAKNTSIIETLSGDTEALNALITTALKAGKSATDILNALASPSGADWLDTLTPAWSLKTQAMGQDVTSQFLFNENGNYLNADGTWAIGYTKWAELVDAWVEKKFEDISTLSDEEKAQYGLTEEMLADSEAVKTQIQQYYRGTEASHDQYTDAQSTIIATKGQKTWDDLNTAMTIAKNTRDTAMAAAQAEAEKNAGIAKAVQSFIERDEDSTETFAEVATAAGVTQDELVAAANAAQTKQVYTAETLAQAIENGEITDEVLNTMLTNAETSRDTAYGTATTAAETYASQFADGGSLAGLAGTQYEVDAKADARTAKLAQESGSITEKQEDPKVNAFTASLDRLKIQASDLADDMATLNGIDVTKMPREGTKAYNLLSQALTSAGKSMENFQTASGVQRAKMLADAQNAKIKAQLDNIDLQMAEYESKYSFTKDMTEANLVAGMKQDEYDALQAYLDLKEEKEQLNDQYEEVENNRIAAETQAYESVYTALENRFKTLQAQVEGSKAEADALAAAIETGELSATQRGLFEANELDAWDAAANAVERASIAAKVFSSYATEASNAASEMKGVYEKIGPILQGKGTEKVGSKDTLLQTLGKMEGITEEAIGAAGAAYDRLVAAGDTDVTMADIYSEIAKMTAELQAGSDEATNYAADQIKSVYANLAQANIEAAEQAVEAWKKAFQEIASARDKLLKGEDLLADVASNPELFLTYFKNYANKSQGMDSFAQAIISGKVTANDLKSPTFDLNTFLTPYGLNLSSGTNKFGRNSLAADQEMARAFLSANNANWNTMDADDQNSAIQEYVEAFYSEILQANGLDPDNAKITAASLYSGKTDYNTLIGYSNDLATSIALAHQTLQTALTQRTEVESALTGTLKTKTATETTFNGKTADEETLNALSQAIANADQIKEQGGKWEDLAAADKALLESYGITSFENLSSEALGCANALATLAGAALSAAQGTAQQYGFYKNGDGVYEAVVDESGNIVTTGAFNADGTLKEGYKWSGNKNQALTDQIEELENNANEAKHGAADAGTTEALYGTEARMAGFADTDEQDDYINYLVQRNEILSTQEMIEKGIVETEAEAIALQRKYANQVKASNKGLKSLASSGKSWVKTLKDANSNADEYLSSQKSLRQAYKELLNLSDDTADLLKDDFLGNEDMLKLAEDAAKGGEEGQKAFNQLQLAAVEAMTTFDEGATGLHKYAEALANLDLEAGSILPESSQADVANYWNGIVNEALKGGKKLGEAIDMANGAMEGLGVELETQTVYVSATDYASMAVPGAVHEIQRGEDGVLHVQGYEISTTPTETLNTPITLPVANGKGGFNAKKGAENPQTQRRSGGGGGSRKRYLAKAKPADHKERYHEINNALDDVSDALERLNEQQDRAWGSARIKAMQQEAELLKEQTELYHQKRKEAEGYLKIDRKKAEEAGWTFDENGNVSNYEERLNAVIAEYNQKIEEYNAMSAQQQEAKEKLITEANERFEKGDKDAEQYLNPETGVAFSSYEEYLKYTFFDAPQEALETYEGTMEEWEEIQKNILTNLYTEYDNYVEQIKYTAENMLEFIDDQIKYIEHKLSRMEDNAYKTAESIGLIVSQIEASESKIATVEDELATLLSAHNIKVEDFLSGKVSADDLKNAGFTDAEIEELRNIMTTAQDAEKDMSETLTKGIESMSTAFESFNEELDRYTSSIEHAQSITSTYRNILDLTGKSLSGFSVELLKAFNESTIEQAQANMSANKTKYETVQVEYDNALQVWELAQAQYAAGLMEDSAYLQAKKTFEDTEDALQEAQESYIASWEAAIQAVADAYQSTMEAVIEDVSKKLANGMTGGLDALSEYMDRAKTTESNYVDDYEKIYQLTKLTRDLDSKIDNTQNVKTQKELLKFQKEINELLQSDKQLSEYDIDYLQKKYDLKLAEIALEDAQNAKSQVTMRRDSEGNYNYVYTADENAVAEAEAEYEGKLYEMQKANDEYITSLSDNIISLEQEMLQAIGALDPAQFASEEDYNNRVADIIKFYTEQMEYQSSEMGKVLANNKSLYDNDMKWYAEYRDYKMADAATFLDSWDKILLAQVSGFSTQEEFFNNFKQQAGSLANESLSAYATWAQKIGEINTSAGTSTETLGEDIGKLVQQLTDDAKEAAEKMETSAGKIKDSVAGITGAVTDMLDKFEGRVGAAADRVDLLTLSIMSLFKTLGVDGFENLQLDGKLSELWLKIQATEGAKPTAATSEDGPDTGYDTGGYTGSWGTEGRLAFLHQKELVLNAHDTENMLASVGILRQIASVIDLNALTSAGGFANLISSGISHNREPLQQEVHIEAHFPNATDKNQIEEAFKDIVNLASQYANSF